MSLKLEQVGYEYGGDTAFAIQALHDIQLEIHPGEWIGLIGHTGSGKSTLVQLLNGLERPTQGHVYFHGEDIWQEDFDRKALRSKVGLVFQYPEHQLFETDVLADVCFGPKNLGLSKEECQERAKKALSLVGVGEELYQVSPFELSGGQKRRVAIAGVLAMEPEILILDEPTAGLDPRGRDEILEQLAKLHKEQKLTVILVSHSMEDVANYVDRVIVLNKGSLVCDGTPREVFMQDELLASIGLAAPNVTYILKKLQKQGFDVDPTVVTIPDACKTILQAMEVRT